MSRRKVRAPSRRPRLQVEVLEDRCVPTTTASVSNGVLTINATNSVLQTTLTQTATNENYIVSAPDLNGNVPVLFTGVTSIIIDSSGNQTVQIDGTGAADTPGTPNLTSLTINAPSNTAIGTLLTVNIDKDFSVSPPGGLFSLTHTGLGTLNLNITGPGTFLGDTVVKAGYGISTATGDSSVTIANANFNYASFQLGGGNNTTSITNANVGKYLSIFGGAANDVVTVQGTTIGQNFATTLGLGKNTATLDNDFIGGNLVDNGSGSANVLPPAAAESFTLAGNSTVHGYVSLQLGSAVSSDVTIGGNRSLVNIGSYLSVTGGNGPDTVNVTNAHIGQNVAFILGGGTNTMTVDNTTIQGTLKTADSGTESLTLNGTHVNGYVSIQDTPIVQGTFDFNNATIGSYLSITAGGSDTVTVTDTSIAQNVALNLGSGVDSVEVRNSVFSLNLSMNLGNAGNKVTITGSTVYQNATVNAGNGADTVTMDRDAIEGTMTVTTGAGADSVIFTHSSVQGAATFNIGAGNDTVAIGDSAFYGSTTINGGAGTKTIDLDSFLYQPPGGPPPPPRVITGENDGFNATFFGPFKLLDPTGTVTLMLGGADATDQDIFWNTVQFQGSAGSTLAAPVYAEYYGTMPVVTPGL